MASGLFGQNGVLREASADPFKDCPFSQKIGFCDKVDGALLADFKISTEEGFEFSPGRQGGLSCDLHLFFPNHGAVPPKSDFISRSNSLDKLSCN